MAVLLAGCGSSSQSGDQGSSQGSEQEEGSTQQTSEAMTNEQTSEPTTNETVVGRCADSGGTEGQQEQASGGEGFNGKIAFTLNSDIYVVDGKVPMRAASRIPRRCSNRIPSGRLMERR
jgi:hypothetical protein